MVHAILGIRPAAGKERLGSVSQDRMDPIITVANKDKESVSPGTMVDLAIGDDEATAAIRTLAARPMSSPAAKSAG